MQTVRIISRKFHQSPFPEAMAPSSYPKTEGTRIRRTTVIEQREHEGSQGDHKRCWRKTGHLQWVKVENSHLVAHPFPVLRRLDVTDLSYTLCLADLAHLVLTVRARAPPWETIPDRKTGVVAYGKYSLWASSVQSLRPDLRRCCP